MHLESAKYRVLVVDDDPITRRVIGATLEKMGYAYTIAVNGREAVAAFQTECFDMVFMDCNMPEMDGFQATAAIRLLEAERMTRVPIISLTGYQKPEFRLKCHAAGMDSYLTKPVNVSELRQLLERCFSDSQGDP